MKKYTALFAAAAMLAGCLSACGSATPIDPGNSNSTAASTESADAPHIVTTIFPEYDWVMNILGDNPANADVTMLLDNGVDLHSYQPTADDIMKIATCDLFIYVGGESDEWVDDALQEVTNKDIVVVNLLDSLGDSVKEEEIVEGMEGHDHEHEEGEEHEHEEGEEHDDSDHEEAEEHDDSDHEEGEDHDHEHEGVEYDEHVWLSLRNSAALVSTISEAIQSIDPYHADAYKSNADAYMEQMNALDEEYRNAVSEANIKTLLFGDRFPFRYLVDDYGLDYYAAFVGCSAETEASFETVIFLAEKVDELGLRTVMTIEGTDHRIAETIIENTQSKDQQILTMDSLQSTTSKDALDGATYIGIMEKNLGVLKEALK